MQLANLVTVISPDWPLLKPKLLNWQRGTGVGGWVQKKDDEDEDDKGRADDELSVSDGQPEDFEREEQKDSDQDGEVELSELRIIKEKALFLLKALN